MVVDKMKWNLKMITSMYVKIRRTLFRCGLLLKRTTEQSDLISIIESLKPWDCGIELIRAGGNTDGGYVIPNDLIGIKACFSPGVADNAMFEEEMFRKHQITSHLADYSVDGPPQEFKPASFLKKFVGPYNNASTITLLDWMRLNESEHDSCDYLLQMDIEGNEYLTVLATPKEILERFRIIVLEIHGYEHWADPVFFQVVKSFFEKLSQSFTIVHIHANNCCGIANISGQAFPNVFEISLIRNDRIKEKFPLKSINKTLDFDNVADSPAINIEEYLIWQ